MPYTQTDKLGYVLTDSSLPTFLYAPNLTWGFEGLSGINGKRYLHYPKMNFYVNDDGTVRAFGYESIPIVNRRGTAYIEIPVTGDNASNTWWTGSHEHTVQNYYRIPIGKTTKYVAPPVLQPKPKQTEEKQKTTEEDTKPVITKPTLVKKPIPIPDDMKEGLVKVEEGIPYYELEGNPEEIAEIIRSIVKGGGIKEGEQVIYEDIPPTPPSPSDGEELISSLLSKSVIPPIKKQHSTNREIECVQADPDNEGVYMYKYPHRNVHIYKISPELAHLVRQRVGNSNDKVDYKYSNVLLRNLPNGLLNDTTYHDIFRVHPSESDWIKFWDGNDVAHSRLTQTAEASISRGYHTDADKVVLMDEPWYTTNSFGVQKQTSLEIDPKTGLYFVRWPKRTGNDTGNRKLFVINTKGHDYSPSSDLIKDVNGNLHEFYDDITYGAGKTMITSAPLSTHMTTYPWKDVVKQQLELLQNDSNVIKRGVDTIKGLFGIKKFGGKLTI